MGANSEIVIDEIKESEKKILGRNLFEIKLDRFFCKLILKTSKCFRILQPKVIGDL